MQVATLHMPIAKRLANRRLHSQWWPSQRFRRGDRQCQDWGLKLGPQSVGRKYPQTRQRKIAANCNRRLG